MPFATPKSLGAAVDGRTAGPHHPMDRLETDSVQASPQALTMYVPMKVNHLPILAVIDSGSQATLASSQLCKRAGIVASEEAKVLLKGIGDEMGMPASVATQVPLVIGNGEYSWTVIIGDIREDFILGLDFLCGVGAQLDFYHGFLRLNDSIILADFVSSLDGHPVPVAPVIVNEKISIPALHCADVTCSVAEKFNKPEDIIVEPVPGGSPVSFVPFIVGSEPHISVPVANLCEHTSTLAVGTVIGVARPVDDVRQLPGAPSEHPPINQLAASQQLSDTHPGTAHGTPPSSNSTVGINVMRTNTSEFSDPSYVSQLEPGNPAGNTGSGTPVLPEHLTQLYLRSLNNLEGEEGTALQELLVQYQDVFARHDFDLGKFQTIMHRIDTGDAAPVKYGLRRTPLGFQAQEEAHLQMMLDHGIIQPSSSAWAAAPVIVKKKDGKYRYCVDYRGLNEKTRRDSFPLPLIEECLDALSDTAFFSTLDMASGYWQIVIDPRDRHKTAFITKYGLFEHVRLAMGLCNSPATYQRIMTFVLHSMLWKDVLVYLDDIIVLGNSFGQHLETLAEVFHRFRDNNLKFKPKKCELLVTEVDFLGRRVGKQGIGIQEAKILSVLEWTVPTTRTELESFLGFINYHREFIPHLAVTADLLYQLAKVTSPTDTLQWEPAHQSAFDQLKTAMVVAPVLAYPNATGTFILDVDASDNAVGAELLQLQEEEERVIAYGSQALSQVQRRYCTTRKELLSLVTFLNHFRFYLLGRYFLVRTDHNSLIWLMSFRNIEGQLARWLEAISQFDFRIVHRPGKSHGNADGLSRISSERCPHYEAGIQVSQLPCAGCKYCTRMHQQWARFDEFVDDVMPLTVRSVDLDSGDDAEDDAGLAFGKSIDWEKEQLDDPDLAIVMRWLSTAEDPEDSVLFLQSALVKHLWRMRDQLHIVDSILIYEWVDPTAVGSSSLLVVPRRLRTEIMSLAHDNICAGHPGPEKMLQVIRRKYFWPGMRTDVRVFAQTCDKCSRGKKINKTPRAPMRKYHAGEPMERIHVDILGPLTLSSQQNKYILVMIDQFTKWIELAAIPEQSAETVAKVFVEEFICRMGCAQHVFSDQGKNFESQLFHQVCELLQMAKSRTTPYRPSANGQVERMNREILAKLRIHIEGKQHLWDQYLPYIGMAMRASVNKSTGFSPNMMMLGREIALPVDLLAGAASADPPDPADYVADLRNILQEVHTRARERIDTSLEYRKQVYDKKVIQETYEVGDLVYLLNAAGKKGQSRKLQPVYTGPFLVIFKRSPLLYVITNQRGRHQVVHQDRMRPCSDSNVPMWARRERNKILGRTVPLDIPDLDFCDGLSDLFGPDLDETSVPDDLQNASASGSEDRAPDLPLVESENNGGEDGISPIVPILPGDSPVLPQLSPSRRSGRERRRPAWFGDYVME